MELIRLYGGDKMNDVFDYYKKCPVCGFKYKSLGQHIERVHNGIFSKLMDDLHAFNNN